MSHTSEALRHALAVYAITPDTWESPAEYEHGVTAAVAAGVCIVQYRDKRADGAEVRRERALAVLRACRAGGALMIVNDDPTLAASIEADGVHVGPEDAGVVEARAIVGPDRVVGASAGTLERAVALVAAGADYLGVGAIYEARVTKANASAPRGLDALKDARNHPALRTAPIVAIGGIDANNAAACIEAGADGVAAVRAILGAPDIAASTSALVEIVAAARA